MQTMSTRVMGSIPRKCKECQTFTLNTVDLDKSFCKMHKCKYRGLFKEWMLGRFWKPERTERKDVVDHTTLSFPYSQSIFFPIIQESRMCGRVCFPVLTSALPVSFISRGVRQRWRGRETDLGLRSAPEVPRCHENSTQPCSFVEHL